MVQSAEYRSELFNTLSELGALCMEDKQFQEARESFKDQFVREYDLSYDDIYDGEHRIGYLNPHFRLDIGESDSIFEVWVNNDYIAHSDITWVQGPLHLYGVLPRDYNIRKYKVRIIHNKYAIERYANKMETEGKYEHVHYVDISQHPYCDMDHPEKAVYYIADGYIHMPEVKKVGDTTLEFHCPYKQTIDMFVCTNLHGIFKVNKNEGTYIDIPYSNRCYYHMIVDDDPDYYIDAQFYPCIKVDRRCTVRVYTDQYRYVPHPELTRLLCYPEFVDIKDPYNTTSRYFNSLAKTDVQIFSTDSDEVILDKFQYLAPYCYRIYEKFPKFSNEVSDFLVLDNEIFGYPTFEEKTIHLLDGSTITRLVSTVPFEGYRDLIFFGYNMYNDFEIMNLAPDSKGDMVEAIDAMPRYVINMGVSLIPKLAIIKFNAAEDTVINNIGNWIDPDNLVRLHIKLNRFYRNMLILRGEVIEAPDMVYVSTTHPPEDPDHMWFELLTNVVPEDFEMDPVKVIMSFGLNPNDIPEAYRVGAYSLNLDPDNGPQTYTQLLFTYFQLGKRHRDYLVMQSGDGTEKDPGIKEFDEIIHTNLEKNTEEIHTIDKLHIDNPSKEDTDVIRDFTGTNVFPPTDNSPYAEGDYMVDHPVDVSDDNSEFDDVLGGVFMDSSDISLDAVQYVNPDTGRTIDGSVIEGLTAEQKENIVYRYITEGTSEEQEVTRKVWARYLETMDEEVLNIAVYKILLTDWIYHLGLENFKGEDKEPNQYQAGFVVQQDEPKWDNDDIGNYWVQLPGDEKDPIVMEEIKKKNIKYIISMKEPDVEEIGTYWIQIPAITMQDYVEEIISNLLMETYYELPDGFFKHNETTGYDEATTVFDYGAHGHGEGSPLFDEVADDRLHMIHYSHDEDDHEKLPDDIWYEFLDNVENAVCYSDTETMVLRIDERLMLVQFEHDNMTVFAFDDIVLNFHNGLAVRYIAILADLVNSGVIKKSDMNIFYRRLITGIDQFDPGLRRLYTETSHVISTAKVIRTDYAITYSTNIGRYHISYMDKDGVTDTEREAAYRYVIDYNGRDFAFIQDRMILFVNGRYIPRCEYEEIAAGKIQLRHFTELIDYVDILYSKKDETLAKLKKIAIDNWGAHDTSKSLIRPVKNKHNHMKPMLPHGYTLQGYYDVLLEEWIFSGRIFGILSYIQEHPDEKAEIIRQIKEKFHDICDTDLVGMNLDESRIVIPAFGQGYRYLIKEVNP